MYSRVRNRLQFGTLIDFIFDPYFICTNPLRLVSLENQTPAFAYLPGAVK
jgi:hypothetical protein